MSTDNKVIHFNSKRIDKGAEDLAAYYGHVGAPKVFQDLVQDAAKEHYAITGAAGQLTFQLHSRNHRGVFETRIGAVDGDDDEDGVVTPFGFISTSPMHMGFYASLVGLTPTDISSEEEGLKVLRQHMLWLSKTVSSGVPGTGFCEPFTFMFCVLGEFLKRTNQVYLVEEKRDGVVVTRHYLGLYTEDEVISISFAELGIEYNRQYNLNIARNAIPTGAPVWAGQPGKIKAAITLAKPKSKIFQKPQVIEEIMGLDEEEMSEHIKKFLAWLEHYDTYYSCEGWTYEVKWKR